MQPTERWSRRQTSPQWSQSVWVEQKESRKQETGTDFLTNGMFLRGTKDNNLFQLHASIPEDQGKTQGGMIRCQLQDRSCWVWVKVAIALLLSMGREPCLNQRPPSIRALSAWHDGSLMVTINNPLCWQSSYLTVLLSAWSCSNDCVLWVQVKEIPGPKDGMRRIQEERIYIGGKERQWVRSCCS